MAGLDIKAPEFSDREWAVRLLARSGCRGCVYAFGSNYVSLSLC